MVNSVYWFSIGEFMRMVYLEEYEEVKLFAIRAAEKFALNEKLYTYTDGEIEEGCLFALRFGLDDDCVVVFKLDSSFVPINYQQLIKQYKAISAGVIKHIS